MSEVAPSPADRLPDAASVAEWEDPPRSAAGGAAPMLSVAGFEGPLDWLLEMARAKKVDLAKLPIAELIQGFVDAFEAALGRAGGIGPDLGHRPRPGALTTVRRVIRSQKTAFRYERGVQPAPKLGEWVPVLAGILETEAKLPRRERRSTQRLFEELRGHGYGGAHDSVHRFAKVWRDERARVPARAFVPLSFAPGEAYQFDWSHETITLQGLPLTIKAAHMKLSHSRMPFVRAYFRETQELVFDAHDKAFGFYGGVCRRGIYDNMKTAVEAIFVGKARQYNRRFLQMCSHHLIEPVACTPASGWEKGQVENQVGNLRDQLFRPKPRVASLAELNAWLAEQCIAYQADLWRDNLNRKERQSG